MSFLSIEGLQASYGSSQALFCVDLTMAEGEVRSTQNKAWELP